MIDRIEKFSRNALKVAAESLRVGWSSVTQCDQIWQYFAFLAKFKKSLGIFNVYIVFGKYLVENLYTLPQTFIDVNVQILNK